MVCCVVWVIPNNATNQLFKEEFINFYFVCNLFDTPRPPFEYSLFLWQGTCTTIDPSSPSTVLGGREAAVERRCVVRLELGARCVAVRCRAARRLRHVLRPVLAKYAAHAQQRAVLRDGIVLHPDTIMQVCLVSYVCHVTLPELIGIYTHSSYTLYGTNGPARVILWLHSKPV